MNLENAKAAEAFPTVGMLFERIFEYAEEHGGELTSVGLSDHFGVAVVKKALGDVLTSFLPEPLRKDAQLARNYVTEDLSKTS